MLLLIGGCSSTPASGASSTADPAKSSSVASVAESACRNALPTGYTLFEARSSSVGELRHEFTLFGTPIVSDTLPERYPGVRDSAPAYRCWGQAALTFVVYAVGPNIEYTEFCEVTLAQTDLSATQPPLC